MRVNELVETQDVRSFFHQAVTDLVDERKMDVADETIAYVTNMLTVFIRSDRFYEWTPQGPTLTPLAILYGEVGHATSSKQRLQILQRVGDVALFVAGMFAESFQRKIYDVDYYIGMGGAAYGSLSESLGSQVREQITARTFAELSKFFSDFVQVLTDIYDHAEVSDDQDILKYYELWRRTGSKRAARRLRSAGIDVVNLHNSTRH